MNIGLRLTQALIGVILVILVFFYYKTELQSFQYQGYDIQVSLFQKYNAELDESTVQTRYGLMRHYDAIVASLDGMHEVIKDLKTQINVNPDPKIIDSLINLDKALENKDRLVHDFKRLNPVLINSIQYFIKLTGQVIEAQAYLNLVEGVLQQEAEYDKYDISDKLNTLYRDILRYTSDPDEDNRKAMLKLIEDIKKAHSKIADLDLVLQYASVVLNKQPEIDALTQNILGLPILDLLDNLNQHYKTSANAHLKTAEQSRLFLYALSILLLITVYIAFKRLQNMVDQLTVEIDLKDKAEAELAETNRQLEQRVADRTKDLAKKNDDLSKTLDELHDTQDQLVIQEKMASVGMLTTGIAHEIKNPLNFINNFSQISTDLVDEVVEELDRDKDNIPKETNEILHEMLDDLKVNASKIFEYGQRADNIVENMLFHSQDTSAQKEMANINLLVKDSTDLACQSMKTTNKNFEYDLQKQLDEKNPPALAAPQAVSRVFLYIINNSLSAMEEKKRQLKESYNPILLIKTTSDDHYFTITVRDNGPGIPEENLKKIFEPFFTTKPTGMGNTGLGLSICYDTIVKQHKGQLTVDSKEGEFAEFVVKLPLNVKNITDDNNSDEKQT